MSGLEFSLGGKLDASYKQSLNQAEAEAKAAGMRIQNSLRTQISGIDARLAKMNPLYSEYEPLMQKRASLEKNLLMVQNAQYLKAAKERQAILQAEAAAVKKTEAEIMAAEAARYAASASQNRPGENPRAQMEAENASMLRNRDALQALIAERKNAAAEAARYAASASQTGGFANPRGSMAADQAAWALKLAEFRAFKGKSGLTAAAEAEKLGLQAAKSTGHIAGLNLVIRESIVLLREWGRGNYARMPGSASLVAQGLAQMGATGKAIAFLNKPLFNNAAAQAEGAAAGKAAATGMIGALTSIPLVAMALIAGSLAAIVAAPIIYFHRVKKLAEELATTIASTFNPNHVARYTSRLEILNELQKDLAESARHIQEAHDSVAASIQRELDLTRSRISFERELLELQKTNALAAVKNPAEREAIEKKFSKLLMANKKADRDAELAAMKKEANELPAELMATRYELAKLTGGGFVSEARDAEILRNRQSAADNAKKYFEQLPTGEKDSRSHSADADRALIARIGAKQAYFDSHRMLIAATGVQALYEVTDAERAQADAARARLKNFAGDITSLNEWIDSKGGRERARARVKELQDKIKEDSAKLTKLVGTPGHGGAIADKLKQNILANQHDLALEQERLKRVDVGRPLSGREVTERERVGFGSPSAAILDVNRSMDRKLAQIVHNTQPRPGGGPAPDPNNALNW